MAYHWSKYMEGGVPGDIGAFLRGAACDAGQVLAASEQLKAVEATLYEASKKPLKSEQLIFRKLNAGEWATSTAYRTLTGAADFVPTAGLADNLPEAEVGIGETSQPVHEFGNAYGFTLREMVIAAKLGMSLDATKAMICMRAYEEKVDKLALEGDASLGLNGLLTIAAINTNRKATSIGIGPNSTPAQILQLLTNCLSLIVARTEEAEEPDCLVMPTKQRDYIANTVFGTSGPERSILEVLVQNSPYLSSPDDIFSWNRLKNKGATVQDADAGTTSTNHVIGAWRRDELVLRQQIPKVFTPEDPVVQGRRWVTNCCALIGGVEAINPGAVQLYEVPDTDAAIDALVGL